MSKIRILTDEEEARLQERIIIDLDNPELTDAQLAAMRPAGEVLPPAVYAALTRPRGRPKSVDAKVPIKLRLDPSVVEYFKFSGSGWQTRMNTFLKANETVLRMIDENEVLIADMEEMLMHFRSGALRVVYEPAEKTIVTIDRNIRTVKETVRCLREQLSVP